MYVAMDYGALSTMYGVNGKSLEESWAGTPALQYIPDTSVLLTR